MQMERDILTTTCPFVGGKETWKGKTDFLVMMDSLSPDAPAFKPIAPFIESAVESIKATDQRAASYYYSYGNEMPLMAIDLAVYANCVLDFVWLYDKPLVKATLRDSLGRFLSFFPAFAGRLTATGVRLSNEGVALSERDGCSGRLAPHLKYGSACDLASQSATLPPRGVLTDLRPANMIIAGQAPLMTVCVRCHPPLPSLANLEKTPFL
mmetsp:Transcript_14510/g.23059  ORF Transcript_14510/g.23059 Transcript_14510/m.23059 type:complete len:210 (+) Transcript_14510:187-816(+)